MYVSRMILIPYVNVFKAQNFQLSRHLQNKDAIAHQPCSKVFEIIGQSEA